MFGGRWGDSDPNNNATTNLKYYLHGNDTNIIGNQTYAFVKEEKDAIEEAQRSFSDVANISFTETSDKSKAEIKWSSI